MNCDIRRSRLKRRSKLDADVLIDNCESPLRYREHLSAQMVPCVVKLSKQAQIDKGGDTTSQPLPASPRLCLDDKMMRLTSGQGVMELMLGSVAEL